MKINDWKKQTNILISANIGSLYLANQDGGLPVEAVLQDVGCRAGQGSRLLGCWWRTQISWWLGWQCAGDTMMHIISTCVHARMVSKCVFFLLDTEYSLLTFEGNLN